MNMTLRKTDIDHGYAWVILAASFVVQLINGVFIFNIGIINSAILESVDSDVTRASWVGATLMSTTYIMGIVAGIYHRRFGPKVAAFTSGFLCLIGLTSASFVRSVSGLLFTLGLTTGFGLALAVNIFGAVPGHFFDKRRSVAFAISVTGGGLGMFLGSPLITYLLDIYGFSGTLLLLGALSFHICFAGVIFPRKFPPSPVHVTVVSDGAIPFEEKTLIMKTSDQHHENVDVQSAANVAHGSYSLSSDVSGQSKETFVISAFRNLCSVVLKNGFIMYNLSSLFWSVGESACFLHLPNYAHTKGSTPWEAGSLISIMGLATIISKLLAGFAATDPAIGYYLLFSGMMGVAGTVTLLFPLISHRYYLQCIYAAVQGLQVGGLNSLASLIAIDLVGLSDLEVGFGMITCSCGIGFLIGPPTASWIFKISGNYDFAFVFAGILYMTSSFCTAAIPSFKKKTTTCWQT